MAKATTTSFVPGATPAHLVAVYSIVSCYVYRTADMQILTLECLGLCFNDCSCEDGSFIDRRICEIR
ncbi:hypothetical protein BJX65DRAFT_274009 [Aspergillus insuetus]